MADPVTDLLAPWAANFSKLAQLTTVFGSTLTTWQTTYIDPLYKVTDTEYTDIVLPTAPSYTKLPNLPKVDKFKMTSDTVKTYNKTANEYEKVSEANTKLKKDYYTLLVTTLTQTRSSLTSVLLSGITLAPTKSANATSALDKIISDFNTSITKLKPDSLTRYK
jgi:hypothetical protein